jgi:hypothetical protein
VGEGQPVGAVSDEGVAGIGLLQPLANGGDPVAQPRVTGRGGTGGDAEQPGEPLDLELQRKRSQSGKDETDDEQRHPSPCPSQKQFRPIHAAQYRKNLLGSTSPYGRQKW